MTDQYQIMRWERVCREAGKRLMLVLRTYPAVSIFAPELSKAAEFMERASLAGLERLLGITGEGPDHG
jgi:hypothetical protein